MCNAGDDECVVLPQWSPPTSPPPSSGISGCRLEWSPLLGGGITRPGWWCSGCRTVRNGAATGRGDTGRAGDEIMAFTLAAGRAGTCRNGADAARPDEPRRMTAILESLQTAAIEPPVCSGTTTGPRGHKANVYEPQWGPPVSDGMTALWTMLGPDEDTPPQWSPRLSGGTAAREIRALWAATTGLCASTCPMRREPDATVELSRSGSVVDLGVLLGNR